MQFLELLLLVIDQSRAFHDSLSLLLVVVLHLFNFRDEVFIVYFAHLLVEGDLLVILSIRLFELVVLLVKLVHVVEQLDILVLCFDESSHNFVDVVNSSRLEDCFEGLLDDLCVTHILVQQPLLLNVLVHNRVHADLQDFYRVGKLLLCSLSLFGLICATEAFIVKLYLLVLGLELFLQVADIFLKVLLAFFVLALECENLVVRLGRHSLIREAFCVALARLLFQLVDTGLHLHDALLSKHDFVTHARDSHSQVLVIALDIVQQDFLVLQLVLQRL